MKPGSFADRCRRLAASVTRKALTVSMAAACVAGAATEVYAATDIVLYASDVTTVSGNWTKAQDATGAGGMSMSSSDYGWSSPNSPLPSPNDYFEATFSAPSYVKYHVWLRLRAGSDSKYNDSVWVQFSDALDSNGSSIYTSGTTSGLAINLENCSGCGDSGWGWQDKSYWLTQANVVQFPSSGTHTIRIQTREDGVKVDQIVLSPSTYMSSAPGSVTNDTTIVAKPATASTSSTTSTSSGSSTLAYSGTPAAVPGQVNGENFDTGGEGTSYHDTTAGNTGGAYRSTNVDIENSAEGGYDIGWIAAGEWLNYTVNVASAGNYTVQLRVASPNGATMHVGFNTASNVWTSVSVPATGGWQTWTTVSVPVTLGAGVQQLTILFDTSGMNYRYANVTSASGSTASTSSTSTSSSGSSSLAYGGSPAAVPGKISAANFDTGGSGTSYYDTTAGNSGGQYRSTDVDIEASSEGGYDIGWTAAGEWLNYTVNVASAGSYTAQIRVASPNGGSMHIGFNTVSNVWSSVSVPATGGWQSWTTVNVPVTLGAGTQQMTIMFDTGGINFEYVNVATGSSSTTSSTTTTTSPGTGTTVNVLQWNIQINDNSETHARLAMDLAVQTSPQPQVIVIEEAYLSWFSTYINELENQTGKTWYGAWASHCALGDWNGSGCNNQWYQGVAILSSFPILNSSSTFFPFPDCWTSARGAARAALNVNGTTVQVFGTHLQTGGCANDAQSRYNSMSMLKSWASNYSTPQIAAGDFNAGRDQIDTTQGMLPSFNDAWLVAGTGNENSAFAPSPSIVIDYWFYDSTSGRAQPTNSYVVQSTGTVSDHLPVHTTFLIR